MVRFVYFLVFLERNSFLRVLGWTLGFWGVLRFCVFGFSWIFIERGWFLFCLLRVFNIV